MRINYRAFLWGIFLCIVIVSGPAHSAQYIIAAKVEHAPVIDGHGKDNAWKSAHAIAVIDQMTGGEVIVMAVYSREMIYFLVQYPDSSENRLHKPWVWDKELKAYKIGPQREDTFNFKWNMEDSEVDLSNFSDDAYSADIWYWKANRTDTAGYADDKLHILASTPGKKATELVSKSGQKRYLMRLGDEGRSAGKKRIIMDYQDDVENQYEPVTPEGSRADIRAKGVWKEGVWTIEFGRKLKTGHKDDIQFDSASHRSYQFGISIAGMYGERIDKTKPYWYGQGRISETLYLVFQ